LGEGDWFTMALEIKEKDSLGSLAGVSLRALRVSLSDRKRETAAQ
jgi:hypothetical protein